VAAACALIDRRVAVFIAKVEDGVNFITSLCREEILGPAALMDLAPTAARRRMV
jgi:hypothetical protein